MKMSYVLLHGINAPVVVIEPTITPTVMQLLENNGGTPLKIFIFCSGSHATKLAMDELYTHMLRNSVGPVVCNKARMMVSYLQTVVFFRPVPKNMRVIMGIEASIVFTDVEATSPDILLWMFSRMRATTHYNISGTILEEVLNRKNLC